MPIKAIPSRRRLLLLAGAALGTSMLGGLGRLALADSDDDDSDNHYEESANTSFTPANTGLNARIVVVGGGMAGATAAKYLRLWGGTGLQVTLVEPAARYTSNIMSNLVLNGSRNIATLGYGYDSLAAKYGVGVKTARVVAIDAAARTVALSDGSSLPYDRLVVAPGVEFSDAYGLTQADYATRTPHAWQAGPQTSLLASQLAAMQNGTFVMTIPKAPYRCPPGPYERACLVADYLKTYRGAGSRVIVLDENATIQAERETFTHAFGVTHAGVIRYEAGVTGIQIDPVSRRVSYLDAVGNPQMIDAQAINPIPPHRATGSSAGGWLAAAGLNNSVDGRWCVVDVRATNPPPSPASTSSATPPAAACPRPATWPTRKPRSAPTPSSACSPASSPTRRRSPTRPATRRSPPAPPRGSPRCISTTAPTARWCWPPTAATPWAPRPSNRRASAAATSAR